MTTHANIKQIGCLVCLAVLLAGCSPVVVNFGQGGGGFGRWGEHSLVVEGVAYNTVSGYGQKDGLVYSLILVFPGEQHYFPYFVSTVDEIKGLVFVQEEFSIHGQAKIAGFESQGNIKDETVVAGATKIADVPLGYVYFIDDRRIILQKSNEELGITIDASDPNGAFHSSYLQPILENLIRENIQPQGPEMEVERP